MTEERVATLGRIRMEKARLLRALGDNRTQHKKEFVDALAGYWDALATDISALLETVSESMQRHIKKAQEKDETVRTAWNGLTVDIKKPVDHTEDFDRAIARLEHDIAEKVDLNSHEFDTYVLNKWDWMKEHVTSVTSFAPIHLPNYR